MLSRVGIFESKLRHKNPILETIGHLPMSNSLSRPPSLCHTQNIHLSLSLLLTHPLSLSLSLSLCLCPSLSLKMGDFLSLSLSLSHAQCQTLKHSQIRFFQISVSVITQVCDNLLLYLSHSVSFFFYSNALSLSLVHSIYLSLCLCTINYSFCDLRPILLFLQSNTLFLSLANSIYLLATFSVALFLKLFF